MSEPIREATTIHNFQDFLSVLEANLGDLPVEAMNAQGVTDLQNCRTAMSNTCCHNRVAVLHNCHELYKNFMYSVPDNKENLAVLQAILQITGNAVMIYIDDILVIDLHN